MSVFKRLFSSCDDQSTEGGTRGGKRMAGRRSISVIAVAIGVLVGVVGVIGHRPRRQPNQTRVQ
jgi:hypothetical protein